MNMNLNLYLGIAAIVAIGVLATRGLLDEEWARTAIAFMLGGAATYGAPKIPIGRKPKDEADDGPTISG